MSRCVLLVGLGLLTFWALWAVVYEATEFPEANYLSFGFVSIFVGAVLLLGSLIGYRRASAAGYPKSDALAAVFVSLVTGLLPFILLLELADYS